MRWMRRRRANRFSNQSTRCFRRILPPHSLLLGTEEKPKDRKVPASQANKIVASVRQGKVFDIELAGADKAKAEAALKDAADKLLANTVIENYRVELL